MIERPLAAAMLSSVLVLAWTTPEAMAETLFREIAWVLLILSTVLLLGKLLGPRFGAPSGCSAPRRASTCSGTCTSRIRCSTGSS